jgi:hypothetical protein
LIAIPAFDTISEELERVEQKMRQALTFDNKYLS